MNDSQSGHRAHAAALRFLSYRPRSESEVRDRLLRRFPHNVVQQVVSDLCKHGLIEDGEFSRLWTSSRVRFKPRSAKAILYELLQKGVQRHVAEEAVCGVDDHENAYRSASKISRKLQGAEFCAFQRTLWGHLRRRGFQNSVAREVISRIWEDQKNRSLNLSSEESIL